MGESKAIKEFKEKYSGRENLDHVIDYLKAVYPYKKRFNFSYDQALKKADSWTKKLNEKNKHQKTPGKVEVILEFEKGFKLVRLIDQESKNWEGFQMGHCVASYKNHQGIYSIRDKNDIPKCTIEVEGQEVTEIKGKANGSVAPAYVDYVVESLKYFNYRIDSREMENIGYFHLTKDIRDSFTNLKVITINNKQYFYTKNKLKISSSPRYSQAGFHKMCFTGQSLEYISQCLKSKEIDSTLVHRDAIIWGIVNNQLVELLFKDNRVDPSTDNNYAIICASKNGHHNVVEVLLKDSRVDPSARNNSAIRSASDNGHHSVVELLLKDSRVDPSADNNYAIRWASRDGLHQVVELLLKDKRVDPSVHDNYAIRLASRDGHHQVVELLLKDKRVDPSVHDNDAIICASENGHHQVVELLLKDSRVDDRIKKEISKKYKYNENIVSF